MRATVEAFDNKHLLLRKGFCVNPFEVIIFQLKHGAILYNEAEVFSLSITNPNGRPMLQFDWLIHSGLTLARALPQNSAERSGVIFLFYFTSK